MTVARSPEEQKAWQKYEDEIAELYKKDYKKWIVVRENGFIDDTLGDTISDYIEGRLLCGVEKLLTKEQIISIRAIHNTADNLEYPKDRLNSANTIYDFLGRIEEMCLLVQEDIFSHGFLREWWQIEFDMANIIQKGKETIK